MNKRLKFEIVGNLADGTSVALDEFGVGGTISIVGADGTKTTAPDGVYTFQDGSVATVTDGKISAITTTPADASTTGDTQNTPVETDSDSDSADAPAEQASDAPADADAATEQAQDDEDEDGEVASQILAIQQTLVQMATDIAALQSAQALMSSDLATHKNITDEKFTAVSLSSATTKTVPAKPLTRAEILTEKVKRLHS